MKLLAAAWLLFSLAVFAPDVGRGFVRDDFTWIEAGREALVSPSTILSPPRASFYRPLVTATFAIDYGLYGEDPRGYGFTNLLLYAACAGAIWIVARRLGLGQEAAALAAFIWATNPHGINMAVVWISGRTALCATLFSLLAAASLLRRQYVWVGVCVAAALCSKEEALALPIVLLAWHVLVDRPRARPSTRETATLSASLAVPAVLYLALRAQAHAFTPASAPAYYQFTFAPAIVVRNALEYLDRGATAAAAAAGLAWIVTRGVRQKSDATTANAANLQDRGVRRQADTGRALAACAVWFAGMYALTMFLPVRSSLYAVLPSAAAALACAIVVEHLLARAPAQRPAALAAALALLILGFAPVYRARNDRWVEPARLSERTLQTIAPSLSQLPAGGVIVLHDEPGPMSSFASAFGTLAGDALRLRSGRAFDVWIDPPPPDWRLAGMTPPEQRNVVAHFTVRRGAISRSDQ